MRFTLVWPSAKQPLWDTGKLCSPIKTHYNKECH